MIEKNIFCCVIVVYKPNHIILEKCILSLISQLEKIYIISNSHLDDLFLSKFNKEKIEIIRNDDNIGIAAAQNIGIKKIIDLKYKFVLMSDQDTVYPKNFIISMYEEYLSLSKNNKIAAICPLFTNTRNNQTYPLINRKNFFRIKYYNSKKINFVTEAISSGMLIDILAIKNIGLMKESLFIDWVDFEWCWRAQNKQYKICINNNVTIQHDLGLVNNNNLLMNYPKFKFYRYYYIFRNGIYLSLYNREIPITWRINIFCNVLRYFIGFFLIEKFNIKIFTIFCRSFYDAVIKNMGKSKKFHEV